MAYYPLAFLRPCGHPEPWPWKEGGSMKNESREEVLRSLTQKKKEFEQSLRRLMENQKEENDLLSGENLRDESDQAQREILLSSKYSLIERKVKELQGIERLIEKIERDDNFGTCEECGRQIPSRRLLIVPEASLCVACQRQTEKLNHMRNLAIQTSSGLRRYRESNWEDYDELDDIDNQLRNAGIEVFPVVDADATDIQDPQD